MNAAGVGSGVHTTVLLHLLYHSPMPFQFLVPHPSEPQLIPYFRFPPLLWPLLPFLRAFLILLTLPLAPCPFPSFPFFLSLTLVLVFHSHQNTFPHCLGTDDVVNLLSKL